MSDPTVFETVAATRSKEEIQDYKDFIVDNSPFFLSRMLGNTTIYSQKELEERSALAVDAAVEMANDLVERGLL